MFARIMRPNTLHFIFTPVPSICRGGYYYGLTVISDTCFAIYHCFVQGHVITNTDHESQAFELLWYTVCYYHDQFSQTKGNVCFSLHCLLCSSIYVVPHSTIHHLPDTSTFNGIIDVVYLACVIELANVVIKCSYPTYLLSWTEHYCCRAACGKAHTLLAWISQYYELYTHGGKILCPFKDVFSVLLGQQAAVLLVYRQENPPPRGVVPYIFVADLKTSLTNCLANNTKGSTIFRNNLYNVKKNFVSSQTFAWTGPIFQVHECDAQVSLKSHKPCFFLSLLIHSCPLSSHSR